MGSASPAKAATATAPATAAKSTAPTATPHLGIRGILPTYWYASSKWRNRAAGGRPQRAGPNCEPGWGSCWQRVERMTTHSDLDGGPADMADPIALAALLASRYSTAIGLQRALLRHYAADSSPTPPHPNWPGHDHPLEGPSLLTPGLKVHLSSRHQDANDLGSFPMGTAALAVCIHVQAFSADFPTRQAARNDLLDGITEVEGDGWVRALLGDHWADHSYALVQSNNPPRWVRPFHTAQRVYVVLLDENAKPLLAPDNFRFQGLWVGVDSARKIEPRDLELAARIVRGGPYADTDTFRDPRTEKDGGWRIEVTGLDPEELAPLAGETAQRLIRGVRIRGAVDTRFRPLRVHVDATVLWVYFQWEGDAETYALTVRPPQTERDLRGPPQDSPGALVGSLLLSWMEELCTGLRNRGHRRRTADGALHLSGPIVDD